MKMSRRLLGLTAGAALVAATLPAAALAATKSTAYFSFGDPDATAYLIDWLPKAKARVAAYQGAQTGRVADDGAQKTITFDAPLSITFDNYDDCGEAIQQRQDTQQLLVRDLPGGVTQFVEMGVTVNVGGCQDGLTVPFGATTDEGLSLSRLAMSARPSVDDLTPGTQVAGFSEHRQLPSDYYPAEDAVTFQAGNAQFQRSGNVVPAAFDANKWLVFSFPGFQRAYTRVAVDAKTGGESWLLADWANGQVQRVQERMMVKLASGAGFGSVTKASRMWEAGMGTKTQQRFFIYLYRNGTGERVNKDLDLGTEYRAPIQEWHLDGLNLRQYRVSGPSERNRIWIPLRNQGKVHWVLEEESATFDGGEPEVWIPSRVNFYIDTGKAVPPAQLGAGSKGMVYLNAKPKQPR